MELSTSTGLIYTQDRKYDFRNKVNAYYFVALDFRTGKVVWEKLVGTGDRFDNWWLPGAIGPNGALYGMVYGGVTMLKDSPGRRSRPVGKPTLQQSVGPDDNELVHDLAKKTPEKLHELQRLFLIPDRSGQIQRSSAGRPAPELTLTPLFIPLQRP